ncbi:MAG: archaeal proteasome endopeptidase complex subunit beta [Thermoplasmatales archaeon]|jgi:proteasome beta subunit|nr:archaeal proteasome endopeptidase complex subunit beta [Thermoplasmatales archaeon]
MAEDVLKTGTTTIGLKCKDGVIMASERRATMGNIIAHSNVQKVYRIADNIGMTIAGLVGDAQLMVRYAQSEVALYSMKRGEPMSIRAASTLISNMIRQGFYVGLIVGGYDKTGGHLFSIDGAGGHIEDNYMSVGSGSSFAMGVIEEKYKEDMTREEGMDLAIAALNSSIRRDSASGDGMLISFIGPDGFESVPEEDIRARAAELGFKYPN